MSSGVLISISFCSISVCLRADVIILLLPAALETSFPDTGFATPICLSVPPRAPQAVPGGVFLISVHWDLLAPPPSLGHLSPSLSSHPPPCRGGHRAHCPHEVMGRQDQPWAEAWPGLVPVTPTGRPSHGSSRALLEAAETRPHPLKRCFKVSFLTVAHLLPSCPSPHGWGWRSAAGPLHRW